MEPYYATDPKNEEFVKSYFTPAIQNERMKQYQQMLLEAKIYDLGAFRKMKLLLNVGKKFFYTKPSLMIFEYL